MNGIEHDATLPPQKPFVLRLRSIPQSAVEMGLFRMLEAAKQETTGENKEAG